MQTMHLNAYTTLCPLGLQKCFVFYSLTTSLPKLSINQAKLALRYTHIWVCREPYLWSNAAHSAELLAYKLSCQISLSQLSFFKVTLFQLEPYKKKKRLVWFAGSLGRGFWGEHDKQGVGGTYWSISKRWLCRAVISCFFLGGAGGGYRHPVLFEVTVTHGKAVKVMH